MNNGQRRIHTRRTVHQQSKIYPGMTPRPVTRLSAATPRPRFMFTGRRYAVGDTLVDEPLLSSLVRARGEDLILNQRYIVPVPLELERVVHTEAAPLLMCSPSSLVPARHRLILCYCSATVVSLQHCAKMTSPSSHSEARAPTCPSAHASAGSQSLLSSTRMRLTQSSEWSDHGVRSAGLDTNSRRAAPSSRPA